MKKNISSIKTEQTFGKRLTVLIIRCILINVKASIKNEDLSCHRCWRTSKVSLHKQFFSIEHHKGRHPYSTILLHIFCPIVKCFIG